VGSTAGGAVILIKRLFLCVVLFLVVGAVFVIIETIKGYFAGFVIETVDRESFATVEFKLNESRGVSGVHLVATQRLLCFDCLSESFEFNAFVESEAKFGGSHDY